jgi:hypothetical protein
MHIIKRVKEVYDNGHNIIQFLKDIEGRDYNTIEDIIISYDFQAGSYIKFTKENAQYNWEYTSELSAVISKLGNFDTIMEAGVGEATTLGNLKVPGKRLGFDISWSRINCARSYAPGSNLFVADLFNIPFADSSIDVVYTSHSIEPNGGREKEAIEELYRVAGRYLILLEPTFEFADDNGKERMKRNGYVMNLKQTIDELGYNLSEYRRFDVIANPLNPTGLYVIEKGQTKQSTDFVCPISKGPLLDCEDHYFSPDLYTSYPKIMDIPCLMANYGVLTFNHPRKM